MGDAIAGPQGNILMNNLIKKMNSVDEIINELEKFSDTLKTMGDPISDHALIFRFEEKFNLTLPLDYKYFISQVNGFSLILL